MVKIALYLAALILVAPVALGQSTTWHEVANPTFSSTSTLVIVQKIYAGNMVHRRLSFRTQQFVEHAQFGSQALLRERARES
jgi:hypothetical protein